MSKTTMILTPPKKAELLAPAGNFEKLEIAVHYGADAVYLSGTDFSLRNFAGNFTLDEMKEAVAFAHEHRVKVYVACNIYARNNEQDAIENFLSSLAAIRPDAVIISDPGILMLARKTIPGISVHLSTQANTTNYNTAVFWQHRGVKRLNMARELSLQEISTISEKTTAEIEAFVHGAMCISYSGRCLLSSFMANRDSNRGMCCHPCRFNYAVVEEKRPGQYYPIFEDQRGSYIFSARDLCMIGHLPEMLAAGITSLKIEGRMKSIHYLASVVKVYREAIDATMQDANAYTIKPEWTAELSKITHRPYSTGLYLAEPDHRQQDYEGRIHADYRFVARVLADGNSGRARIDVRNQIRKNDDIEILSAKSPVRTDTICNIFDLEGNEIDVVHPGNEVNILLGCHVSKNDIIRQRVNH
jgi:putative protease